MKIEVFVDGSIRPKSHGLVSIGVVFVKSGTVIHEISENIGVSATSQVAELFAVMRALQEAKKIDATELKLYSDNIGNIKTLNTKETTNNGENLKEYFRTINQLEKYFSKVSYIWISAEENQLADMLARGAHEKPQIENGNSIKDFIKTLKDKSYEQEVHYFIPYVFVEHSHQKGIFYKVNLETKECTCNRGSKNECIHIKKAFEGLTLEKNPKLAKFQK